MDTSIIVALISAVAVVLAAIITAFGVSSKSIHKLELQITEMQATLNELVKNQTDNSEILKKIDRNTKFAVLNRGKIFNIDKRVMQVESDVKELKDAALEEDESIDTASITISAKK